MIFLNKYKLIRYALSIIIIKMKIYNYFTYLYYLCKGYFDFIFDHYPAIYVITTDAN